MPYRVPDDLERKVYFAFLKQASSLTGWRRVLANHTAFLDIVKVAFEETQKHPPPDGEPYIDTTWMRILYSR